MFIVRGEGLAVKTGAEKCTKYIKKRPPAVLLIQPSLLSHIFLLSCLFPSEAYSSSLEAKGAEGKM